MLSQIDRVEQALSDLAAGKMIILLDDNKRENEGDIIVAAEKITPDIMNFIIRHSSGIVCLAMLPAQLSKLQLPLMVSADKNSSSHGTPFTVSIDAKDGIATGVSAADRAHTILQALSGDADTLVRPGHIFPLQAQENGVLARCGHTEGAVDLAHLAGLTPAAVLCEIMNPDGTMTKGAQIEEFATTHQLTVLSIEDIIHYRLAKENLILEKTSTILPIEHYGEFHIAVVKDKVNRDAHIVLEKKREHGLEEKPTLVRIHSSCVTGDLFASLRCDCNKQLHYSLQRISQEGGVLIYLNQEGRGVGLFDKIRAYALQDEGYDTVQANEQLGLPIDSRQYYLAAHILRSLNLTHIRLLTNNPDKIFSIKKYGVEQVERESMPSFHNDHNLHYLKTKNEKLNHLIDFDCCSTL